ncbi:MAG TPA: PQQ-binding-like beta-propeller repeat protein [Planctomycetota bacterium]|nr:PQQ-binding-like beta-propeller repeat protein [Planctomycetota bacterium]
MASLGAALLGLSFQSPDWATHRGGPTRTGNVDGKAGPAHPKVLWVLRSKEHFIAPPSPEADRLFVCVMGAFNTGAIRTFDLEGGKAAWSKSAPVIRMPTVCSPSIVGGKVVFGEGMHQTDGASIHCMRASDGRSLWRLELPGELIHVEASPTVAEGKVYAGGGNAGVVCMDLDRVTLEGKEIGLAEAEAELDKRWKVMADKYEVEKKKDPDFAIPPNEASLPRPAPRMLWQKGKGAWHVDAPLLVTGGRVYAASAYLDKEQQGDRALFCLNAADGAQVWKAPLRYNAWAGATLAGDKLLVPCSTIRYDPKEIPAAKGEIVALKVADGTVAWRKDTSGAVLASVAVAGDRAITCDTNGQITALDVSSGQPLWTAKAGAPFFAGPAVAGDAVYAGDLDGGIHAVALSDGKPRWKLDLATDPAIHAPGMVYGSPVVHGGRLYVGTCNLEGKAAGGETVIVSIGEGK